MMLEGHGRTWKDMERQKLMQGIRVNLWIDWIWLMTMWIDMIPWELRFVDRCGAGIGAVESGIGSGQGQAEISQHFPTWAMDADFHMISYDFPSWKAETSWFFNDVLNLQEMIVHWEERAGSSPSSRRFLVLCFNKLSGSRAADHFILHPVQPVRQGSDARSLEDWKDAISQIEENIKERKPMQPWFASHASVIFKNARAAAHCSSCRLVFFQFQSSHAGNTYIYIYIL